MTLMCWMGCKTTNQIIKQTNDKSLKAFYLSEISD